MSGFSPTTFTSLALDSSPMGCKVNQSINQISIVPISLAQPGSVAQQVSQCSTAIAKKQFHNINMPSGMLVCMRKRPSQTDVFSGVSWRLQLRWLKRQIAGRCATVKCPYAYIGLDHRDQQSDSFVWSQWMARDWCGKYRVKTSRLFFRSICRLANRSWTQF